MPERLLDKAPKEMRIALGQFRDPSDDLLTYITQLGAQDFLMNTPAFPGDKQWEYEDLLAARKKADKHGLRLMALENVPITFYDKIMLGQPGRDEQINHMQNTIRNMGNAGIPILGIHWMPSGVWSTQPPTQRRGGATARRFEMREHPADALTFGRVYTAEEMWENFKYYMEAILPVAEEVGVTFAIHPDDPPVESLGGVARIFRNFEGFKRAMDHFDTPHLGLNFCIGCWSEMGGRENVLRGIRHFAPQGKLIYIHFRDVEGVATSFSECFINEGNLESKLEIMQALKENGFNSFLIDDHVPHMIDDSRWGHRGRAYAIGYLAALVDVVNKMPG
ncbi:MAG: mannonate dehydratase [Litorilinea sp.]